MKEESTDELGCVDGEESTPIAMSTIAIGKRHSPAIERYKPFVADGNPVGIAAEIAKHLCGTGHRWLAVDDPFTGESLAELLAQGGAGGEILSQEVQELSTEDSRQDAHGDEEVWSRGDPAIVSWAQAAARHDAVDMRVEGEGLRPGVKDGDRAGRCSDSLSADDVERFKGGLEEEGVAPSPVGEQAGMDRCWHGENDVEVRHRKQVPSLRLDPPRLIEALTLRTVTIPT